MMQDYGSQFLEKQAAARAAAIKAAEERQRAADAEKVADAEWLDLRAVRRQIRFSKELDGTGNWRYGPVTLRAADLPEQARERLAAWGEMAAWLAEAADDPAAELTLDARPLVLEHGADPTIHPFYRAANVAHATLSGWTPGERDRQAAAWREAAERQAERLAERRAAATAATDATLAAEREKWDAQDTPTTRLQKQVAALSERVARLLGGREP